MRFDAREVQQSAEPITPVVYIGRELLTDDAGVLYFQDADSYSAGIRFPKCANDDAEVYAQGENEINHIFEFERALDALLACSLRRTHRLEAS